MDDMLTSLAVSLASHMMEDGLGAAWSALVRLVKERASRHPETQAAIEAAVARPDDATRVDRLADELHHITDSDEAFRVALTRLWPEAKAELAQPKVSNQVNGIVMGGGIIQAGTAHFAGGISFGSSAGEETRKQQ
jgi:hypothetical protein